MKRNKTKRYAVSLIGVLLLIIVPRLGYTEVPQTINYQGYLTDSAGTPIDTPPGMTLTMHFSIYNVASGGTALWSETQHVTINSGIYSVILGSVNPSGNPLNLPFDIQYYLGVEVGADGEMSPRQALTSVPSALNADVADYAKNADTVDNMDSSDFATASHVHDSDYVNEGETDSISSSMVVDGSITNDDINAGASIAYSKLNHPDTDHTSFAPLSHDHDTRYYDKAYIDALEARIAALEPSPGQPGVTISPSSVEITDGSAGDVHTQDFFITVRDPATGIPIQNANVTISFIWTSPDGRFTSLYYDVSPCGDGIDETPLARLTDDGTPVDSPMNVITDETGNYHLRFQFLSGLIDTDGDCTQDTAVVWNAEIQGTSGTESATAYFSVDAPSE